MNESNEMNIISDDTVEENRVRVSKIEGSGDVTVDSWKRPLL